jgi:hypothetical protein
MVTTRTTLLAMVAALALPAGAAAKNTDGLPSGNSGAYQYVESIPTARGSKPDSHVHAAPRTSTHSVPSSTERALLHDGSAGRAAYSMAAATAPKVSAKSTRPPHRRTRQPRTTKATAIPSSGSSEGPKPPSGSSRAAAVLGAVTGVGTNGSGVVLLIILVAVAAGAVALVVRRRRAPAE